MLRAINGRKDCLAGKIRCAAASDAVVAIGKCVGSIN